MGNGRFSLDRSRNWEHVFGGYINWDVPLRIRVAMIWRELQGAIVWYLVVELELNSPNLWYTIYTRSSLLILSECCLNTIIYETCWLSNSRETKLEKWSHRNLLG